MANLTRLILTLLPEAIDWPRLAAALLIALAPAGCLAQETAASAEKGAAKISFGLEADFNSRYVWHGIAFSEGPVKRSTGWITVSDVSFYATGNFVLGNEAQQGDFNEVDFGVSWKREWKKLRFEPSFDYYLSLPPAQVSDPSTGEATLQISHPIGPMRIFTSHTFDVVAYRGAYFGQAGLSYEGEQKKRVTLAGYIALGWASSRFNEAHIGARRNALNVVQAEVSLTYALTKRFYFRPHFELSGTLDRRLRSHLEAPTIGNYGVAVGFTH